MLLLGLASRAGGREDPTLNELDEDQQYLKAAFGI